MKFTYYYKKSDGVRREGHIEAETRDAAFVELRKVGIRPIKMIAGDGSKENGASRPRALGVEISIVAIVVLALSVAINMWIGGGHAPMAGDRGARVEKVSNGGGQGDVRVAKPRPRKWIGHDREFLYEEIFAHPSEAFLARFAEPGYLPRGGVPPMTPGLKEDLFDCIADDVVLDDGEDESVVSLKRIVAGLKQEVEMMLGTGMSVEDVVARLTARQQMEIEHRNKVAEEVAAGRISFADANTGLSAIGVRVLEEKPELAHQNGK